MTHFYNPGLSWSPLNLPPASFATLERMKNLLASWEGTPYVMGMQSKQIGTYCTAFVCSILDGMFRREPTAMIEIPEDVSMHSPEKARSGLKWFLRKYPCTKVESGIVQPGDVLVTGPTDGGPGHALFVGPQRNTLWQCSAAGVHFTGMALPRPYELHGVYRMKDREQWI